MNALNDAIRDKNRRIRKLENTIREQNLLIKSLQASLKEAEKELEMNDYSDPVDLTDEPNDDIMVPPPENTNEENRSVRAGFADGGVRKHRPGHTGLDD